MMHLLRHHKIFWTFIGLLTVTCISSAVLLSAPDPLFDEYFPNNHTKKNGVGTECCKTTSYGTLMGHVTIGPNCPVEREGVACDPTPEAYAAREFVVLDSKQKQVAIFHGDSQGNFSVQLPSGTYTVASVKSGMGYLSSDLPKEVVISPNETTEISIDIDTGIR